MIEICCHLGCKKPATQGISSIPETPDSHTFMCEEHVEQYIWAEDIVYKL